MHGEVSII